MKGQAATFDYPLDRAGWPRARSPSWSANCRRTRIRRWGWWMRMSAPFMWIYRDKVMDEYQQGRAGSVRQNWKRRSLAASEELALWTAGPAGPGVSIRGEIGVSSRNSPAWRVEIARRLPIHHSWPSRLSILAEDASAVTIDRILCCALAAVSGARTGAVAPGWAASPSHGLRMHAFGPNRRHGRTLLLLATAALGKSARGAGAWRGFHWPGSACRRHPGPGNARHRVRRHRRFAPQRRSAWWRRRLWNIRPPSGWKYADWFSAPGSLLAILASLAAR